MNKPTSPRPLKNEQDVLGGVTMALDIRPLTQEQRQSARQAAREAVLRAIGAKPIREHFAGETISKYPVSMTRMITLLCLILLLAAFTPSAIRLYVIGSQTFGQAVPNQTAKNVVGLATVLSAEVGQVVFSLALATLGASRSARRLLYSVCSSPRLSPLREIFRSLYRVIPEAHSPGWRRPLRRCSFYLPLMCLRSNC